METAIRGDSESDSLLFPSLIVCLFQSCSSYCDLQGSQNILILFPLIFFPPCLVFAVSSRSMPTDFWKHCGHRCAVHLWHSWKQAWISMSKLLLVCAVRSRNVSEMLERCCYNSLFLKKKEKKAVCKRCSIHPNTVLFKIKDNIYVKARTYVAATVLI